VLDGRYRFDNFVVGASNRLAASAAHAVADSPGAVYNPLVLYSAPGLGKTHLLAALGHAIRRTHPAHKVVYLTIEEVVDRLHATVAAGEPAGLMRRLQDVDVLLLDDVQFLTGRRETQTEILRALNALQGSGRQIVLTCDRTPSEIADVDERLLTRLAGGLIVDIGIPEYETRMAILRRKCEEHGLRFDPEQLEELATVPVRNVRELEGALHRLRDQHAIVQVPPQADHGDSPTMQRSPAPPEPATSDDFESFLSEMAVAVSQSVEHWRVRLGALIARWTAEGYGVDVLQRALEGVDVPDVDALARHVTSAVARLRALEKEAVALDPKLSGVDAFRDTERVAEAEMIVRHAVLACDPPPAPNPLMTIDTFVSGERNQLALRGAGEVIGLPGKRYNPLFVYGSRGAGKTHLLHAIANALAARDGGTWTVACVGAGQFASELITALQTGALERWRSRYRAASALVVDDVQDLAGKDRSQEELLHLFNALHEAGTQIVLAADVSPAQLVEIAPRLRSRFEGGHVVELGGVPEAERVARHTPVPDGAEAAAPTIDAWFDEEAAPHPASFIMPVGPLGETDTFFLDPEKCVTEWTGAEGRIIEDPR
jgi:chromosomal replication initiator protein